jgi:peptide/nickel transport system ATP-binding protein
VSARTLLEVASVTKRFPVGAGWLHAVEDVSFAIRAGECVGLVGESGCGKSTLVRLITRLLDPTGGRIWFDGRDIGAIRADRFARDPARRGIQMVFQDPTDSLNPRFRAADAIADPLRRLGGGLDRAAVMARVRELAEQVGLPAELLSRFPHQLSGGQKQRVGIARALALDPALLILDEPTSALDVSVQAVILRLLDDLRRRRGLTYLFISHDLGVVRLLAERVLVMYLGRIVEAGPTAAVFSAPHHPYTRALVAARPGGPLAAGGETLPAASPRLRLVGEPQSPIDPRPDTCQFHGRCPEGFDRCTRERPSLRDTGGEHWAACHLLEEAAHAHA